MVTTSELLTLRRTAIAQIYPEQAAHDSIMVAIETNPQTIIDLRSQLKNKLITLDSFTINAANAKPAIIDCLTPFNVKTNFEKENKKLSEWYTNVFMALGFFVSARRSLSLPNKFTLPVILIGSAIGRFIGYQFDKKYMQQKIDLRTSSEYNLKP